ncbi:hypothetical protein C8R45DRAFT_1215414 [Mycena sanguinolenta]|nr:hypothetical protein C8R45DRAFT_1215414 [Mycena sanguinolenta]
MQLFQIQNPDIRYRLRYNILPSDVEKEAIRLSIDFAKSHLRVTEIQAHSTTHDSNAAFRRYILDYTSLLAPIRRLSVEILLLIFLDPDLHDSKWIGTNQVTVYQPYAISGVSYRWREVTRATPILWSSFQISFRRRQCTDLERIRTALELSKHLTLSISFGSAYMYPEDGSSELRQHIQAVTEIAAEILLHAERWGRLVVPLERNFLDLLFPARGRLLCLQELGFGHAIGMYQEQIRVFEDAPNLRSLCLHEAESMHRLPVLPWVQLTQISTPLQAGHTTEEILEQSSKLRDVIFYIGPGSVEEHQIHPHRNPEMRKIVLIGTESAQAFCVMDALRVMQAPALKELYVISCWAWNPVSIQAFLHHSRCSLQTLVLERTRVRPAELLALFPAIPSLGTLVLLDNSANSVTNVVLEALTPSLAGTALPSLHTFVLRGTTYFCSTDKLLALLEGRIHSQPHPPMNLDIVLRDRDLRTADLDRASLAEFSFTSTNPVPD